MNLSKLTTNEVANLLKASTGKAREELLALMAADKRKVIKRLVISCQKDELKQASLWHEHQRLSNFERKIRRAGFTLVAGLDESGRGALAGPLVAAAVVLPTDEYIPGLRDCKQVSAGQREQLYQIVTQVAIGWEAVVVDSEIIDEMGIHQVNLNALTKAALKLIRSLSPSNHQLFILTDAFSLPPSLGFPNLGLIKGDEVSLSIAAASIISKVTRDRIMRVYHQKFPAYRFDRHKGYGTAEHRQAIQEYGPCPIHRKSFAGVG